MIVMVRVSHVPPWEYDSQSSLKVTSSPVPRKVASGGKRAPLAMARGFHVFCGHI